ncbi:hypothetical protein OV207_34095 [Corallococcus sp. BB11-1]|nr:hypothetical protein [Corallococcus sp. BB11-1]MCY1036518.1 hypothetical protein [Corallococcus sp. BB11-1]
MNEKKKLTLNVETIRLLSPRQSPSQNAPCSSTRPPTWAGVPEQA